jgi:predicted dehydrogenase
VLQEGMHIRHLRKLQRQRALVASGELGRLLRIESCFRVPRIPMARGDFRLGFEQGGGAGLDLGCYAVACLRYLAGGEPEVLGVSHRLAAPRVDRWMRATYRLPSVADGVVECGFRGWYTARIGVEATCERGSVTWSKGGLTVKRDGRAVFEAIPDDWTYQLQLQAFVTSTRGQTSSVFPPEESVANARVLEAMYVASGLGARPTGLTT